ncbi:hypothetical protein [Paenibacillus woosongensis]|nr:hypothetical protein [Paenibacillus woosongensis]
MCSQEDSKNQNRSNETMNPEELEIEMEDSSIEIGPETALYW